MKFWKKEDAEVQQVKDGCYNDHNPERMYFWNIPL